MRAYPDVSGPPRSYIGPLLAVLVVVGAIYGAFSWYLQGLPEECKQQCIASGHKGYQYIEATGFGKYFRQGTCSCLQ